MEGMRPAGLLWLPMWITPRRKVPVVMTSRLQRILSPAWAAKSGMRAVLQCIARSTHNERLLSHMVICLSEDTSLG